jgi:hypothetical protein
MGKVICWCEVAAEHKRPPPMSSWSLGCRPIYGCLYEAVDEVLTLREMKRALGKDCFRHLRKFLPIFRCGTCRP